MKLLMMEGNPLKVQKKAAKIGVRTASQVYINAIKHFDSSIKIDIINGADGEKLEQNKSYSDYSGLIISGSSLRAFEPQQEVLNQINFLKDFATSGLPILGSCWGLQIAAIASGGQVGPSNNGRELGIARKITKTEHGFNHPFLKNKNTCFDAPCIHYDEVTRLPSSATLLASNEHSKVQAAIIPVENSEVWGVQYHPEFDIAQLQMLMRLYKQDMFKQNFLNTEAQYANLMELYDNLENEESSFSSRWQLGIDNDILDINKRAAEISNWLDHIK